MSEEKNKGFTVKDKRIFSQESIPTDPKKGKKEEEKIETEGKKSSNSSTPPLPELNFSSFILSLSSSALLHFGEIPDPVTNKKQRNLTMAKQTIDILGILKEKTSGNLTKEEQSLLDNLLYDLRIRYVKEVEKGE